MQENTELSLEDALDMRTRNGLFLSFQTKDTKECEQKIKIVDNLIEEYEKKCNKIKQKIEKYKKYIQDYDN